MTLPRDRRVEKPFGLTIVSPNETSARPEGSCIWIGYTAFKWNGMVSPLPEPHLGKLYCIQMEFPNQCIRNIAFGQAILHPNGTEWNSHFQNCIWSSYTASKWNFHFRGIAGLRLEHLYCSQMEFPEYRGGSRPADPPPYR